MSSLDFPWVSGTNNITNAVPNTQMKQKPPYVIAGPRSRFAIGNSLVTANVRLQFRHTAIELTHTFASVDSNSAIINHGNGPKPMEKAMMNVFTAINGIHPPHDTSTWLFSIVKWSDKTNRLTAIPNSERISKMRLPARSTIKNGIYVDISCSIPTIIAHTDEDKLVPALLNMSTV